MRHFVFIDESGEANISNPDPRFNVFVLCGILFREDNYEAFNDALKVVKRKHFGNENVVFHSYHMRKKEGAFKVFQNADVLSAFYVDIGKIFTEQKYTVISSIVNKEKYKEKYPDRNFAYEDALTFLVERSISCIGKQNENSLLFCLETRSNRKDVQLKKLYTRIVRYGTDFKSTSEFKVCHPKVFFRAKEQNINGLQFSDLCAFPIAIRALTPGCRQPTYDLFDDKIYCNWHGKKEGWGLKHFP